MAMIFTMVMAMKEELDNIMLDVQKAEEDIINEKRRKEEEAEQAKFVGTKVTVASFMEWKKKFDAEMLEKDAVLKAQRAKELKGKLSGNFNKPNKVFLPNNNAYIRSSVIRAR